MLVSTNLGFLEGILHRSNSLRGLVRSLIGHIAFSTQQPFNRPLSFPEHFSRPANAKELGLR